MVKNTNGGKGAKSLARKLSSNNESHRLRLSTNDFEKYAIVTKMLGNGMCYITTHDQLELICHIRGKFRGRSKRNHFVTNGSYVLIGIRDWENPYKNCDLLELYDNSDVSSLSYNPSFMSLLSINNSNNSNLHDDDVIFDNDSHNHFEDIPILRETTDEPLEQFNYDDI